MKFPYGISEFDKIITQGYFYVDRTEHIRSIEEYGDSLLFLRPRRFGKSLLLSTLENYYDVNKADEFERLFGHLAIGQNPTERHNQYLVMRWDFSIVLPLEELADMKQVLYDHINDQIHRFATRYAEIVGPNIQINPKNAISSFASALTAVEQTPYRMYLLIDEYDNFANKVLMSGQSQSRQRYEALVKGEGVLKTLFSAVKSAMSGFGLDRTFITGVSPVVMSDITSGHNISEDISLEPAFYDVCGFWEREIEQVLVQLVDSCSFPPLKVAEGLEMIKLFYDGYCFQISRAKSELLYNPTLSLYFLKHYQRHCRPPRKMLDGNFAMDRTKIAYVASLPEGERLVTAALAEKKQVAIYELEDRFGVADLLEGDQERNFFASLLYYLGVLTLDSINDEGLLILKIPNLVVRKLYVEDLQKRLLPGPERTEAQKVARRLYKSGDMQPLCDFIEQRYYPIFDNRDYKSANELTLKTIFLTVLFNDTIYIMDSELVLQRTYSDLTMIVRPEMRQYQQLDLLMEFKYLRLGQLELSGQEVKHKSRADLLAIDKVKETLKEAITQVKGYRKRLLDKYGTTLDLRTFAIVGLGFERLIWEEVP